MVRIEDKGTLAPGPGGWAQGFANLNGLQAGPVRFFRNHQRRYGDIVRIRLGPFLTHLITHPDHVKHVLQVNNRNYRRGRFYKKFNLFFGQGILTSDGPAWKQNRSVLQPAFQASRIDGLVDMMAMSTQGLADRWDQHKVGLQGCNIVPEMMSLTMEILGRAMFDTNLGPCAHRLEESVETSIRTMFPTGATDEMIPLWVPTRYNRSIRRAQRRLHERMREIITDHESPAQDKKDERDIVALMLQSARQGNAKMHGGQILDEMMTVFLAGHETSGSALAWTLYNLARFPEIQTRVRDEVDRVLQGNAPSVTELPKLAYTQKVVSESLRLYPPIWLFPREAVAHDNIGGYRIPKGSTIFLCPYITHRLSEFWDDPAAFNPDRFTAEQMEQRHKYAFYPFGGGQRLCIGNHMANLNLLVSIAMFCQRFRFEMAGDLQPKYRTAVSLRQDAGIPLRILPRQDGRRMESIDAVPSDVGLVGSEAETQCPYHA